MKSSTRRTLAVVVVLAVIALLAVPKLVSRAATSTDQDVATPSTTRTLKVTVERMVPERLVEELATTGTVLANERVELVSEISGKIEAISFREGMRVDAGQVLVKLDDDALVAEQRRIQHRLALAERREKRQGDLLDEGVISQDDYDLALEQLEVLRSDLELNAVRLERTEVRAPFAGVIGLRQVSPGSFLTPQTPIATLQNLDSVKVDFSVPEQYASRLSPGATITFFIKGLERDFEGTIYAIEPTVDQDTRSLLLRAQSENPGGVLFPGAFADVRLVVEEVPEALTVPSIAVIPELGGKKVYVLEGDKAVSRPIQTGIRTEERVQVTAGLEPGERVITTAIQQLRDGLDVEPVEVTR